MNKSLKYIISIARSIILLLFLFSCQTSSGQKSINEMYDLNFVDKAEVSLFKKNEYIMIDNEKFLDVLANSKPVVAKFIPYKEVVLYKKNKLFNTIYLSKTNKYIKIEENTFTLTEDDAKLISDILTQKK